MSFPHPPARPTGSDSEARFMQLVWDMLWDPKTSIFCDTPGLHFDKTPRGYLPKFKAKPSRGAGAGGYMGEYDQTKAYSAGMTFDVSQPLTVAGIAIAPGLYGVPPAGTDSLGKVWAGNVPANPTGNAVPQYPLPAIGAAPNDKFYAKLLNGYCSIL